MYCIMSRENCEERQTLTPIFSNMVLDGTVVEKVTELKVLGVVLDTKLSFQGHIM